MGEHRLDGAVDRRGALRWIGVAIATSVLGGCTADVGDDLPPNELWPVSSVTPSLPIDQREEHLEEAIQRTFADEIHDLDTFVASLADRGVEFVSVEQTDLQLELQYVAAEAGDRALLTVVAMVAGAYAALVGAGSDAEAAELLIIVPGQDTIGVADISGEWARTYVTGELTAAEFGELVAATIESKRTPPDRDIGPDEES